MFFCLLKSSTFGTKKNINIFHDPFSKTISYKKNVIWKIVGPTGHHTQAYINLKKNRLSLACYNRILDLASPIFPQDVSDPQLDCLKQEDRVLWWRLAVTVQYSAKCTLYCLHFTVYTVQCRVYSLRCSLHSVHFILQCDTDTYRHVLLVCILFHKYSIRNFTPKFFSHLQIRLSLYCRGNTFQKIKNKKIY